MGISISENGKAALEQIQSDVRSMVLAGLEQIQEGKTKDFHEVCDRLEKKYKDAALRD
ncbi:MAG: hypothetical protein K2N87_16850 [Eubacterium sp.]|nr:hypothetical protein [Eubacterium sp.]